MMNRLVLQVESIKLRQQQQQRYSSRIATTVNDDVNESYANNTRMIWLAVRVRTIKEAMLVPYIMSTSYYSNSLWTWCYFHYIIEPQQKIEQQSSTGKILRSLLTYISTMLQD